MKKFYEKIRRSEEAKYEALTQNPPEWILPEQLEDKIEKCKKRIEQIIKLLEE